MVRPRGRGLPLGAQRARSVPAPAGAAARQRGAGLGADDPRHVQGARAARSRARAGGPRPAHARAARGALARALHAEDQGDPGRAPLRHADRPRALRASRARARPVAARGQRPGLHRPGLQGRPARRRGDVQLRADQDRRGTGRRRAGRARRAALRAPARGAGTLSVAGFPGLLLAPVEVRAAQGPDAAPALRTLRALVRAARTEGRRRDPGQRARLQGRRLLREDPPPALGSPAGADRAPARRGRRQPHRRPRARRAAPARADRDELRAARRRCALPQLLGLHARDRPAGGADPAPARGRFRRHAGGHAQARARPGGPARVRAARGTGNSLPHRLRVERLARVLLEAAGHERQGQPAGLELSHSA